MSLAARINETIALCLIDLHAEDTPTGVDIFYPNGYAFAFYNLHEGQHLVVIPDDAMATTPIPCRFPEQESALRFLEGLVRDHAEIIATSRPY